MNIRTFESIMNKKLNCNAETSTASENKLQVFPYLHIHNAVSISRHLYTFNIHPHPHTHKNTLCNNDNGHPVFKVHNFVRNTVFQSNMNIITNTLPGYNT